MNKFVFSRKQWIYPRETEQDFNLYRWSNIRLTYDMRTSDSIFGRSQRSIRKRVREATIERARSPDRKYLKKKKIYRTNYYA
jgi:hypothetical protein